LLDSLLQEAICVSNVENIAEIPMCWFS